MDDTPLQFALAGRLARLTLTRAAVGNTFTMAMMKQFVQAMQQAAAESDVLILAAQGADFSLGRDRGDHPPGVTPAQAFALITELNDSLDQYPGIIVSRVQGRAYGFGVGLVMRSDVAIAGEEARFALDEVKLGIPPMFIMAQILNHLPEKAAMDLILSSREIEPHEARAMGLLTQVVPRDTLERTVEYFAASLLQKNPDVLRACKRYLRAVRSVAPQDRAAFALAEQTAFALQAQAKAQKH